jgi:flagellar assembly protein FliH
MGHLEKFLFETSFDAENAAKAKARAAAAVQTAVEEPPAPTFSEKDLEAARQTAFAAGKAAGIAEAEGSHGQRLAQAAETLPSLLAQLARDIAEEADQRRRETLEAALTVVRKLFPQLARSAGLTEVHAVIEQCLERLRDEPRVVIRCPDADLDALRAHVEQSAAKSGFEGKLVFLADERLAAGDLRVEWADGGAERDQASLWKQIDAVIARALTPAAADESAAGKAGASRKPTPEQAAPQRAASLSPQPEEPAAVQPLRRAKIA